MFNDLPIWPVYLENYLKSRIEDIKTDFIHLLVESGGVIDFESYTTSELINKCYSILDEVISKLEFKLDSNTFICISGTTSFHFLPTKVIAEYLKEFFPDSTVVFGGGHASSAPYDFNYSNSPIDYVVMGEGEIPLYNLIKNESKKQKMPKIVESNPIQNLNKLSPLDLSLLDKYIKKFDHLSISLSRGCPYNCYYCMERTLRKEGINGWRVYSPKRAVKETLTMINFGLDNGINTFGFQDPMFGLDREWMHSYLDLFELDERVQIIWIENRVDLLNKDLLIKFTHKKMAQMYGLESCSRKMLKIMNKTSNPTEYLKKFNNLLKINREIKGKYSLNLVFNHPGETRQTYKETFDFLKEIVENDVNDTANFETIFYHQFPGNRIYNGIEYYNKKYGTKIYYPEWWKKLDTLKFGAFCVKPSFELSLVESINIYTSNMIELLKFQHKKSKEKEFSSLLQYITIIKSQKCDLLKYLEENEIS